MSAAAESVRQVRAGDAPLNASDLRRTRSQAQPAEFGASRIEIVLPGGTCVRVDDQVGGCGAAPGDGGAARMIPMAFGARVWLASGHTDMRRGMRGLALQVGLGRDPFAAYRVL